VLRSHGFALTRPNPDKMKTPAHKLHTVSAVNEAGERTGPVIASYKSHKRAFKFAHKMANANAGTEYQVLSPSN
jgi:hypothetical protein